MGLRCVRMLASLICRPALPASRFRPNAIGSLPMLEIHGPLLPPHGGLTRREWLRIGGVGLGGLSLTSLLQAQASAAAGRGVPAPGKAKSVILLGLLGGPPQHETWDPKPDAPAE